MGLGAPKKREKISHDPNNTAWSSCTSKYGQRILSSHGWKPGDYLGACNASHVDHYTKANASHIRVLLRDENLGLGARVGGNSKVETFGLSMLSGIFGRLNGKSEDDVWKQQGRVKDAELSSYQARKYGCMNFVSGGLLVGDQIVSRKQSIEMERPGLGLGERSKIEKRRSEKRRVREAWFGDTDVDLPKREKRRSMLKSATDNSSVLAHPRTADRKGGREETAKENEVAIQAVQAVLHRDDNDGLPAEDDKKEHRTKLRRKGAKIISVTAGDVAADEDARRKYEKRTRREERRRRKGEKRRGEVEKSDDARAQILETSGQSCMPAAASTSTIGPTTPEQGFGGSRHAVRQRYIQQKRMASMDPQALKEILMLKATA